MASTSTSLAGRHDNRWFPPWFIWPLFFLTSSLRVYYVMQPRNWWIVHPDEIYQTMEVAHSEVYGYGFRTYEFNSEPTVDEMTPDSRRNEAQHGLWALRSHLLPHVYVLVTWLLGILGLDFPPFVTWKVFHTLAASTLVPVVYLYVSVVFRSRDTASLAAILCAACCHLTVLGTHTLVNSLVAPPVFLALTHLHTLVSPPDTPDSPDDATPDSSVLHARGKGRGSTPDDGATRMSETANGGRKASRSYSTAKAGGGRLKSARRSVEAASQGPHISPPSTSHHQHYDRHQYNHHSESTRGENGWLPTACTHENSGPISNNNNNSGSNNIGRSKDNSRNNNTNNHAKSSNHNTRNNNNTVDDVVVTASENVTENEPLITSSTTTTAVNDRGSNCRGVEPTLKSGQKNNGTTATATTTSVVTTVHNGYTESPRGHTEGQRQHGSAYAEVTAWSRRAAKGAVLLRDLTAGFALGVCVYVRIDVMALVVVTTLAHWRPFHTRYLRVVSCACGALAGVGLGVSEDFRCYGWGVLTPYNWFRFNVQMDYSSVIFGRHTFHKYVVDVVFLNAGTAALAAVTVMCAVSNFLYVAVPATSLDPTRRKMRGVFRDKEQGGRKGEGATDRNNADVRTLLSWLALLFLYSSKGHKELRFVHNLIVLMLVTCADIILSTLARRGRLSRQACSLALYLGVAVFALSQWRDVVSLTDDPKFGGNKMALSQAGDTQDVNQCLHLISTRSDVSGVFIDRSLYATGGYSLLHHDVPVFTMFGTNFHEYSREFRWTEPAKTALGRHLSISVSYVGRFSNYMSWLNAPYAIKFVVQDPRYNYLLIKAHNDFSPFGFDETLFYCGTYKVLRRPAKPTKKQAALFRNTIATPPLNNASLLMHEADMLFFHGAWARAADRFRDVLRVDPSQVGVYVPLAISLYRQGDEKGSADAMRECYIKFGMEACERRRSPLVTNYASGTVFS